MAILESDPRPPMSEAKVYFIQCLETKRVKIGIAQKPIARLTQIQTMSPTKVDLVLSVEGGLELEKALHKEFAETRLHGEWFEHTDELATRMDELLAKKLADGVERMAAVL